MEKLIIKHGAITVEINSYLDEDGDLEINLEDNNRDINISFYLTPNEQETLRNLLNKL